MIEKTKEKEQAILLRRQGKTYSEILSVISVAKSTLSLWLREVGMAKRQMQRFTDVKRAAGKRGGAARKQQRLLRSEEIISRAHQEVGKISSRELFLIGTMLYWAEGAKEKVHRPGQQIDFINMDPRMVKVFLVWLLHICKVPKDMIGFETYLHESHIGRIEDVKTYWSKVTGFPMNNFSVVRLKKHIPKTTVRKNIEDQYFGALRIKVFQSSHLVRKIAGWTEGIVENIERKI